jgi:hypothetical protein
VHLLHADRYSFVSRAERRTQSVRAAYLAPKMFEGGGMRAYVFPVEPKDADHWNALIAVEFPVPVEAVRGSVAKREFGVVLQRGSDVEHTFHRSIALAASAPSAAREHRVTFLEPADLKPGRYVIHAVVAAPSEERPFAEEAEVVVPPIPRKEPFLVGPMLGRRSGDDVVVFGGASDRVGTSTAFRPLLVSEVDRTLPLGALTQACVVKPGRSDGPWLAERSLLSDTGEAIAEMPGIQLERAGKSAIVCKKVFDELPIDKLPIGRYTFQATLVRADATLLGDGTKRVPIALVGDAP